MTALPTAFLAFSPASAPSANSCGVLAGGSNRGATRACGFMMMQLGGISASLAAILLRDSAAPDMKGIEA